MLKGVRLGGMSDADVLPIGGARIQDISAKIYYKNSTEYRHIEVQGYRVIVLHVGTNDVANGRSHLEVVMDMKELLDLVLKENLKAVVMVSSVLYRPMDHTDSGDTVDRVNYELDRLCTRYGRVLFTRSYAVFKTGSRLLTDLYQPRGLHLSNTGKVRLGEHLWAVTCDQALRRELWRLDRSFPSFLRG